MDVGILYKGTIYITRSTLFDTRLRLSWKKNRMKIETRGCVDFQLSSSFSAIVFIKSFLRSLPVCLPYLWRGYFPKFSIGFLCVRTCSASCENFTKTLWCLRASVLFGKFGSASIYQYWSFRGSPEKKHTTSAWPITESDSL